ncbi:hypothetical protein [Acidiphilium iwatense]|uniref:Uncharacterized protein n=1 Tax=Acidiphilium iwatense TaxID=768198 RepID=A0ABS9E1B2_9PROT|nr:hypothetical protein [Acidiphilium iwatense]MCF3948799.1 hypothetical protein [Acidiphilium iwatense]
MVGINLYEAYKKHVLNKSTFETEREVARGFVEKFIKNEFYATGWRSGEYKITRIDQEFWILLTQVFSNNTCSDGIEIDYIGEKFVKKECGISKTIYSDVWVYEEPFRNEYSAIDVQQSTPNGVNEHHSEHQEEMMMPPTSVAVAKVKNILTPAPKLSSKILIKMDDHEYGQIRLRLEKETIKQEYRIRNSILESLRLIDELRKPEHRALSQNEVISILSNPALNRKCFTPSVIQKIYSGNYGPFERFVREFLPASVR